ncbi:MAG: hypothetical protein HOY75_12960 [Streptomyces sp.]|nr:hypothetical protein [Streptomyces sp.]
MSVRLAVHWTVTWIAAAATTVIAPLPFEGPAAGPVGALAATAVACIGYATAPTPRKAPRR